MNNVYAMLGVQIRVLIWKIKMFAPFVTLSFRWGTPSANVLHLNSYRKLISYQHTLGAYALPHLSEHLLGWFVLLLLLGFLPLGFIGRSDASHPSSCSDAVCLAASSCSRAILHAFLRLNFTLRTGRADSVHASALP